MQIGPLLSFLDSLLPFQIIDFKMSGTRFGMSHHHGRLILETGTKRERNGNENVISTISALEHGVVETFSMPSPERK